MFQRVRLDVESADLHTPRVCVGYGEVCHYRSSAYPSSGRSRSPSIPRRKSSCNDQVWLGIWGKGKQGKIRQDRQPLLTLCSRSLSRQVSQERHQGVSSRLDQHHSSLSRSGVSWNSRSRGTGGCAISGWQAAQGPLPWETRLSLPRRTRN